MKKLLKHKFSLWERKALYRLVHTIVHGPLCGIGHTKVLLRGSFVENPPRSHTLFPFTTLSPAIDDITVPSLGSHYIALVKPFVFTSIPLFSNTLKWRELYVLETPSYYQQNKSLHKYDFLKFTLALKYETCAHRHLFISPNTHTHIHIYTKCTLKHT